MSKKKSVFTITEDLSDLFIKRPVSRSDPNRLTIQNALATIARQMEISGNRPRTISDYSIHVNHFKETTGLTYWYSEKHKPTAGKRTQQKRKRGVFISIAEGEKCRTNWLITLDKDCPKLAIVTVPFSYHLSKNHFGQP